MINQSLLKKHEYYSNEVAESQRSIINLEQKHKDSDSLKNILSVEEFEAEIKKINIQLEQKKFEKQSNLEKIEHLNKEIQDFEKTVRLDDLKLHFKNIAELCALFEQEDDGKDLITNIEVELDFLRLALGVDKDFHQKSHTLVKNDFFNREDINIKSVSELFSFLKSEQLQLEKYLLQYGEERTLDILNQINSYKNFLIEKALFSSLLSKLKIEVKK